jgi:hypothetical protein
MFLYTEKDGIKPHPTDSNIGRKFLITNINMIGLSLNETTLNQDSLSFKLQLTIKVFHYNKKTNERIVNLDKLFKFVIDDNNKFIMLNHGEIGEMKYIINMLNNNTQSMKNLLLQAILKAEEGGKFNKFLMN